MGALSAKKAILKLDISGVKVPVGEVRSFSLETSLGTIDVSNIGTDWKEFLVGQAGWTASMELFYDPTDTAQDALIDRTVAGTPCEFVILPFGEDDEIAEFVGTGVITSKSLSGATEDAIGMSVSVQGNGELELNPA